jgi:hypothetical protein
VLNASAFFLCYEPPTGACHRGEPPMLDYIALSGHVNGLIPSTQGQAPVLGYIAPMGHVNGLIHSHRGKPPC